MKKLSRTGLPSGGAFALQAKVDFVCASRKWTFGVFGAVEVAGGGAAGVGLEVAVGFVEFGLYVLDSGVQPGGARVEERTGRLSDSSGFERFCR